MPKTNLKCKPALCWTHERLLCWHKTQSMYHTNKLLFVLALDYPGQHWWSSQPPAAATPLWLQLFNGKQKEADMCWNLNLRHGSGPMTVSGSWVRVPDKGTASFLLYFIWVYWWGLLLCFSLLLLHFVMTCCVNKVVSLESHLFHHLSVLPIPYPHPSPFWKDP